MNMRAENFSSLGAGSSDPAHDLPSCSPRLAYHAVLYHSMLPMGSVVWVPSIDWPWPPCWRPSSLVTCRSVETDFYSYPSCLGLHRSPDCPHDRRHRHHDVWLEYSAPFCPSTAAIVTLVAGPTLWLLRPPAYRAAVRGLLVVLILAGCNAVWMVPQLVYRACSAQPSDPVVPMTHPVLASERTAPKNDGRIISASFYDELSL